MKIKQIKVILFCKNSYAFEILKPLADEGGKRSYRLLWYFLPQLEKKFPFKNQNYTTSLEEAMKYQSDVILVPGNEVPHFLRGVKVQIFHGFAGEKKGHFRIRNYFDLYLTQGSYFTEQFYKLRDKYRNFYVAETGWSKLDPLFNKTKNEYLIEKQQLLDAHNVEHLVLYAPTFSPSLASAKILQHQICTLGSRADTLVVVKFHDLMKVGIIARYKMLAEQVENLIIVDDQNILKYLRMADILISDTSSVIYEFILLDKPVITYCTKSTKGYWENITQPNNLVNIYEKLLNQDDYKDKRKEVISLYHPYVDGQSSRRVYDAIEEYIDNYGIPNSRSVSLYRQIKIKYIFNNVLLKRH